MTLQQLSMRGWEANEAADLMSKVLPSGAARRSKSPSYLSIWTALWFISYQKWIVCLTMKVTIVEAATVLASSSWCITQYLGRDTTRAPARDGNLGGESRLAASTSSLRTPGYNRQLSGYVRPLSVIIDSTARYSGTINYQLSSVGPEFWHCK